MTLSNSVIKILFAHLWRLNVLASSMLTCSPYVYLELIEYADLHHPSLSMTCFMQVCQLTWLNWMAFSMLTCITHVYLKSHGVCWLTSPRYIHDVLHASMSTYITHGLIEWHLVCWLASPMCTLNHMEYADLHHPGISMTCIMHVCQLTSPMA